MSHDTPLDQLLQYLVTKRVELVAQVEEADAHLARVVETREELLRQMQWIDEQYRRLMAEAGRDRKVQ